MLVARLEVPEGTRLLFQPERGPVTTTEFHFLGTVVRAETHASQATDGGDQLEDERMVLDCRGVEASELTKSMNWPAGEPTLPGTVQFGGQSYPAILQVRPRPRGLRAILRKPQ
jgi:hypothetical protein